MQELNAVYNYLMEYIKEHALTEDEFHLVGDMFRDIHHKRNRLIFNDMTDEELEELEQEYAIRVKLRRH